MQGRGMASASEGSSQSMVELDAWLCATRCTWSPHNSAGLLRRQPYKRASCLSCDFVGRGLAEDVGQHQRNNQSPGRGWVEDHL